MKRTKGQVEAEISEALVKFEREYMGRGPTRVKTYIVQDMIIVRLAGVLTPAEEHLIRIEGVELIKQVRAKLLESGRRLMEEAIRRITGCQLMSMHADLSTKTGERVILFTLEKNLEERLR